MAEQGWANVSVVEADACQWAPPEGAATLVTFSYSLSSEALTREGGRQGWGVSSVASQHLSSVALLCVRGDSLAAGDCARGCSAAAALPAAAGISAWQRRLTAAFLPPSLRPRPVIPPFHAAVDRAISYLDRDQGLLGVCDFYTSAK